MYTRKASLRRTCLVLALAIITLAGCGRAKQAAPAPQTPEVAVVNVSHGSVPVTTELPGRTSAYLVAQVRARVDGIVQRREFEEGADVTQQQRLYQIDPSPYQAALDSAQAQLARARANVGSTRAQAQRDEVLAAG